MRRQRHRPVTLPSLVDTLSWAGRQCLLLAVVAALATAPAAAQRLLRLTPVLPEDAVAVASAATTGGTAWGAEVDLHLIRTGPETLEIPTPDGVLVEVAKSRFEDRGDGNTLWVGRVAGTDHDHVQLTVQDGHLVGWYSEPHGRQFELRARPDGGGRVESSGSPRMPICAVHDPELASVREEVLARMRERSRPAVSEPQAVEQPAHAAGAKDIVALIVLSPDVVYEWELAQGSDTFAEVQALFDYANLVFTNSGIPAHVVPPEGTRGVVWAPLTLLTESLRGQQPSTILDRFDLTGLRSLYGADVVQWIYWDPGEIRGCGRADGGIWPRIDDGAGNLVVEPRRDAALRAFERTNSACGGSGFTRATFVHEIGHSLGAQHDRQEAPFVRCEADDTTDSGGANFNDHPRYAYGCHAYGSVDSTGRQGTVMSYARPTILPYFSRAGSPSPYTRLWDNGHWASNAGVLFETATRAADFFEEDLPPAPPTGLQVTLSGGQYLLNWQNNHVTQPDRLFVAYTTRRSSVPAPVGSSPDNIDFGTASGWSVTALSTTDTSAVVTDPRPGYWTWFVACVERHGRFACTEPGAEYRDLAINPPIRLGTVAVPGREDIVQVVWTDPSDVEHGFKIQARSSGATWPEPGHEIGSAAHFVRKRRENAYVWDLDRFGSGAVEIRVCAVRILGTDSCSDPVVVERTSATVGFDSASVSVNEGDEALLTLRLSEAVSSDVTLAWSTADGTATAGSDYTAHSGNVTIAEGQTTADLTVQTLTDSAVESSERFEVTIAEGVGGAQLYDFNLDSQNQFPIGITHAGGRFYVVELNGSKVYAYGNRGARASSYDFNLDSDITHRYGGATYVDGRFYVTDEDKVFAYDSSGSRAPSYDFDLDSDNTHRYGVTYVDGRFYVTDEAKVFAYDSGGGRASSYDFDLDSRNRYARGITHVDGRFYVVDDGYDKVFAYDSSGSRASSYDFDLDPDSTCPRGITHVDGRFYVAESCAGVSRGIRKVFSYSSSLPTGVTLGATTATVTIVDQTPATSATVGFDSSSFSVNEGDQAHLTVRLSEAVSSDLAFVWSTSDGTATAGSDYTAQSGRLTITGGQTTADLTVQTLTDSAVEGSEIFEVSIGAGVGRASSYDFNLDSRNVLSRGITHDGRRFYVVEWNGTKVYAYDNNGTRASSYDFSLGSDVRPGGITHVDGRFYVVDESNKFYAYDSSGTRASSYDFSLDSENTNGRGITYVDGRFYVVDISDDKVYAYDSSGSRASPYDFDLDPDNRSGSGIAYVGDYFYVVDSFYDKVYAYDSSGSRASAYDFNLDSGHDCANGITHVDGRFYSAAGCSEAGDKVFSYSSSLPTGVSLGTTTAAVTIVDQTPATSATVGFDSASVSVNEGDEARLTVRLSEAISSDVSLGWHTADGTATGIDFTRVVAASVGIRAGQTTAALSVPTLTDQLVEGNETFQVTLYADTSSPDGLPDGVTFGTTTATVTIVDQTPTAPSAPSSLRARAVGPDEVRLTWTDNSSTEDGFEVQYRRESARTWTTATTVAADSQSARVGNLADGRVYEFRVRATSSGSNSDWSNVATASLAPAAPTNFRVLGESGLGQIRFAWDDNSSNESGYVVRYKRCSSGSCPGSLADGSRVSLARNATRRTLGGLTVDQYYSFEVVAVAGQVESEPSNLVVARSTAPAAAGASTDCTLWGGGRIGLDPLGRNGRFEVRMCYELPNGVQTSAFDYGLEARDSGLLYFFDRDNAEVLLKVLDFCSYTGPYGGNYWVFIAPVTTLGFRLSVEDSRTGRSAYFRNSAATTADSGIRYTSLPCSGAAAGVETTEVPGVHALPGDFDLALEPGEWTGGGATETRQHAQGDEQFALAPGPPSDGETPAWLTSSIDETAAAATATCSRSWVSGLRLKGGYRVSACWEHTNGSTGSVRDWGLDSEQSALLYFFDRNNAEILIKVLDGCRVNGHRWVFVASATDLGLRLRVTAPDGRWWDYTNGVGQKARPRSDTAAFSCR